MRDMRLGIQVRDKFWGPLVKNFKYVTNKWICIRPPRFTVYGSK